MNRSYRIIVVLAGGTEYHLCTVATADAVASVVETLAAVKSPEYSTIKVEICVLPSVAG